MCDIKCCLTFTLIENSLQKAYICNYKEHWFTVRKIGRQWFNLNSLLTGPELISNTYLSLFLTQLQREGYAIFVVSGILPSCTADTTLADLTVVQHEKPRLLSELQKTKNAGAEQPSVDVRNQNRGLSEEEERELQEVLRMSIESNAEAERLQLEAALAMSLQSTSPPVNQMLTEEEMLDRALKMSLEAL